MAKKSKKRSSSKKRMSGTKKDVAAFVAHLEKNREVRTKLRKAWSDVVAHGKKKGFKFTREELRNHLNRKYGVKRTRDNPDTCFCI